MMTNINNLPDDLVMEILSRVPVVSLARFRSTSKRWNVLIGDGGFAKKHYANAPKLSLVILVIDFRVHLVTVDLRGIQDNIAPSVKLACQFSLKDPSDEEVDIGMVFHCDGLLLCITNDHRIVVWNPCSRETMWVQTRNPYLEGGCYALGKSSCNNYKILCTKSKHEYEIYDITSNSWRSVCVTTDWVPYGRGIYVNGNAYWLNDSQQLLLSFDFSTERFQIVPLPEDPENIFFRSYVAFTVTREGQQLCMLATDVETNVWIANKSEITGAMSWSKFITVARNDLPYRLQFTDAMSFLVYEENKVVLSCNDPSPSGLKKNIIHIVGEDKYIQVDHLGADLEEGKRYKWISVIHSYVPSLAKIQQDI